MPEQTTLPPRSGTDFASPSPAFDPVAQPQLFDGVIGRRFVAFIIDAAPGQAVRMDREDFIELVANVIDNARKWAASRTEIRLERAGPICLLTVSDDGPGIPAAEVESIVERGRRLDERTEGTGIGLAIVKDIAEAYGLETSFTASPP